MTVDFQLGFPCPHLTVEERVSLESDRRTLKLRQPVNSGVFTQIIANSDLGMIIPMEGLDSQARVVSSESGPFRICKGQETVTVTNPHTTVTVNLPLGNRVSVAQVVERFQRAFREASAQIVAASNNGHLTLSDISEKGPRSRIQLEGAPQSVGFTLNTGARGQQVFPGWEYAERSELYNQLNLRGFVDASAREIRFLEPVRSSPVLKVSYTTTQSKCRRCRSTAVENDYRFDAQGDALMVGNEDLLQQAMLKILTTRKGSNPFHTYYGSLLNRIGVKNIGVDLSLREDVSSTVETFKALQKAKGKFQDLTAREQLRQVLSLSVTPSDIDPTVVEVRIVAQNSSGRPVQVNTVFAVPGVGALVGSNGLSLGLDGLGLATTTTAREIFG